MPRRWMLPIQRRPETFCYIRSHPSPPEQTRGSSGKSLRKRKPRRKPRKRQREKPPSRSPTVTTMLELAILRKQPRRRHPPRITMTPMRGVDTTLLPDTGTFPIRTRTLMTMKTQSCGIPMKTPIQATHQTLLRRTL
ncbi:hypothetical protein B0H19DRAFT_345523 [Mycena capillaripes]|nr:hypothetical protein B0H19DRAFT_345523 [Mycena capillaripes]